ncbi:ribosomal protein S12 methylthiotransferase RimO [Amycolatopsis australiensis]|uniref:Ribosomal protein uS12 methylthiotransferase RimO n=1 Tax=Amycolatopsis australiensis TaxID=546364 RepID=A0A1K1SAL2_9PSEU|nr:ribosomal protein S12 methylthiotransferase RimO [Amycolatopsis australiensis]
MRTVSLVTLGCARNEVDSDELAARLGESGWRVAAPGVSADVVVVNTCGFIEAAKKESIDAVLAAAGQGAKVVAVGCLAERYGRELADALPEADAVLSFDDYSRIGERVADVVRGHAHPAHTPRDRRKLLPITPAERPAATPGRGPRVLRHRLGGGPVASLKLASGCDRRCSFCAIPSFRGAFVSRPPAEVLAEAEWLAGHGVRELVLVSENSTSYGKDLGDLRALEKLLPKLAAVADRVRVTYLQPAELRPGLLEVIAGTPGVAPYFDLSFQHASGPVLRRMRRFGDRDRFLGLLGQIRAAAPDAGVRSNFIVGFPGETDADFAELKLFLEQARLDAAGVFGYSDEDGTEAAGLPGKVPAPVLAERVEELSVLAETVVSRRAADRVGTRTEVLAGPGGRGWAAHQGPEVDGHVTFRGVAPEPGSLVRAEIVGTRGVDLEARVVTQER